MAQLSKYLPLDRPVTFLDAGANIGMASLLFSHLIMGNGQVLSVEANPETAQVWVLIFPNATQCDACSATPALQYPHRSVAERLHICD